MSNTGGSATPIPLPTSHAASPNRATELQIQLQSIYDTLPTTDLKQFLMVYIMSPELVGTDLVNAIKEDFRSQRDLFTDFACTRTTLRILRELLRSRGVNVDCRQGVKIATGVTKALYGEQASVSVDDEALVRSHTQTDHTTHSPTADSHSAVQSTLQPLQSQEQLRGTTSTLNNFDMSRLAHNVSSRFKDYKYDGSLEKPISEYIAEYDAVARDFDLVLAHKLRFFHVVFSGSAKRFYFAQVEPVTTSYTDAKLRMCNEFNSPSRQQRILQMVSTLKFSQFLKDDHRNALNDLVERISILSPMCPTTHKQDAHLKKFLHDACIGEQWASAVLSRASAEPEWTFHMMATHLAAAVQQFIEEQEARRIAHRKTPPIIPINLLDGRISNEPMPRTPKFYGVSTQKGRYNQEYKPKGPSTERPCRGCGSTEHWLRDGVCNGRDVAEFLKGKLHSSPPGKVMYELLLPEDESNDQAENCVSSGDESSGPEHATNFVLTGHNEAVEADSDLIYESLIAQKIQSEISSSMSKLDVEPSGASSSVPSIKGRSNKDFQLA
jgi:hypothetical protein